MKKVITLVVICVALVAKGQQEPLHYTLNQFNSNLEFNPAYAGANESASLSLRGRKQWMGFDGAPTTFFFNAESRIKNDKLAGGLTIIKDKIGITNNLAADLSLATHVKVSKTGTTSIGIKIGVNSINSDFSRLKNVDLSDPLYANPKVVIPYVGLGGLYYTKKLYLGLSVPRIMSIEDASPQSKIIKPHVYLYGGYRIKLNEEIELRPALLGKYVAAAPVVVDIALDAWYKGMVGIGVSYRTMDAVNYMIKARMQQCYFGYSYDMTTSKLRTYNSGTHEVYLGFEFGKKGNPDRNQNNRYF